MRVRGGGAPQLCIMQCSAALATLICLVQGATELRVFKVVAFHAALIGGGLL